MQHVRHIKPEFYVHEGVNDMTVNARYAETGTWTCCDKHGRFEWKPRMLKRLVMPYDDVDFESLMHEWVQHGFAEQYRVDGETYGRFFNWEKHQGINLREKQSASEYPAPPEPPLPPIGADTDSAHADTCLHVQTRAPSEGKGKGEVEQEGQGVGVGHESPLVHDGGIPTRKKVKTKTKTKIKDDKTFSFSEPDLTLPKSTPSAAGNENQTPIIIDRVPVGLIDPDLPTIGDIPTDSLPGMLDAISDGTFETGVLKNYAGDISDLETACRQSIRKFYSVPLTDRSVLARVVSDVMEQFEQADLRWHPGFLKVVATLRAGGALQLRLPERVLIERIVRGDVFEDGSVLTVSDWRADLLPHKELIQKIADVHGVPQTFSQAADFMDQVIEDFWSRNEPVPEELERAQENMRERIEPVLPKRLRDR
jgi:hypothetical protein